MWENPLENNMNTAKDNSGFVLISAIILLAILTVIGITGIMSSNTEIKIAGNDLRHKQVFYQADGAARIAIEMIEQSLACQQYMPATLTIGGDSNSSSQTKIEVVDPDFAKPGANSNQNQKNLTILGEDGLFVTDVTITGSFLPDTPEPQSVIYEIFCLCKDIKKNARARIKVRYLHVPGANIPCPYQNGTNSQPPFNQGNQQNENPSASSKILSWEILTN